MLRKRARAEKIASGSTSRPISRAISASVGMVSTSATNAGSSAGSAITAASAAIRASSSRGAFPARIAATFSISSALASDWIACQRLNGSESCAARNFRSSPDTFDVSLIGAEKPRLSDSTGRSATPVNSKTCAACVSVRTPRTTGRPSSSDNDMSRPSAPTRPIASGMTIGSFTGWPGVGGTVCAISSR